MLVKSHSHICENDCLRRCTYMLRCCLSKIFAPHQHNAPVCTVLCLMYCVCVPAMPRATRGISLSSCRSPAPRPSRGTWACWPGHTSRCVRTMLRA